MKSLFYVCTEMYFCMYRNLFMYVPKSIFVCTEIYFCMYRNIFLYEKLLEDKCRTPKTELKMKTTETN